MTIEYQRADPEKLRANVPTELRDLPMWLTWKEVADEKGQKPRKVPHYADGTPRNGTLDTPKDRERLVTFDQVMRVYERDKHKRWMGPGIALGTVPNTSVRLSGIDWDKVRREDGLIVPKVKMLADASGSYVEISPSGTGLKVFGTGDIGTEKKANLEIYSGGRFFTVTGEKVCGDHLVDLTVAAKQARELMLSAENASSRKTRPSGGIPDGTRNNTLWPLACQLRGRGVSEADAWRALQEMNDTCLPPFTERELKQLFERAWKYAAGFPCTDLGNAERLVRNYGDSIRFLRGGGWYVFEPERRYVQDADERIVRMMSETARSIYAEAATADDEERRKALGKWASQSESRKSIANAIDLARSKVSEQLKDYDTNPALIGLRNGVYDLERDEFRAGRHEDRITLAMNVDYAPEARCPRWEQFQREIHRGDDSMVAFKQRAWGYTLSGDVSEQKLFLCYGEGANGKTTEQNVVMELQGQYACKIEPETLLVRKQGAASNDIARLKGARFVATVEVEDGRKLAESLVKQLTGGDKLAARFMYQEFFEFRPVGKFWIATNHKPEITGTDYAIWRRILLVPYLAKFSGAGRDPNLERTLKAEIPGIFNWMLEGYRQWKVQGLAPPDVVTGATKDYRDDQDRIGNFLRECCKHGPDVNGSTPAGRVYLVYKNWTRENGQYPLSAKKFHDRMRVDHGLYRVERSISVYPNLLVVSHDYDDGPGGM